MAAFWLGFGLLLGAFAVFLIVRSTERAQRNYLREMDQHERATKALRRLGETDSGRSHG